MLDKYLSKFQFNEIHSIKVNAHFATCYNTAMQLNMAESKIIKFLFQARGLPFRRTKLNEITQDMNFTLIEEKMHHEFVYAFLFKRRVESVTDKILFIENVNNNYNAKVGWSFSFTEVTSGITEIQTETRVYCFNNTAKFIFGIYWFFVRYFSGWSRIEMLKLIKKNAEQDA